MPVDYKQFDAPDPTLPRQLEAVRKQLKEKSDQLQSAIEEQGRLHKLVTEREGRLGSFKQELGQQSNKVRGWKIAAGVFAVALFISLVVLFNAQQQVEQLQQQETQRLGVVKQQPLAISQITLMNGTQDGHAIGNSPADEFDSGAVRFIFFHLTGPNQFFGAQDYSTTIYTKYVNPEGVLSSNPKVSPDGFTLSAKISMSSGNATWVGDSGWGSQSGGTFEKGVWRIQFFDAGKEFIAEKSFSIK